MCTEAEEKKYGFTLVEVSILPDIIISLMPFLVDLLPPKKNLTLNFLDIPRSAALVLELSPIPN